MSISEPFIRRPIGTSLLMLGVLVFGIGAYGLLPVAPLPNVDFPTIAVTASYPGASPQTMASAIATPLETQFTSIPALAQMTSLSGIGTMTITLQFDLSRNIDGAAGDVLTAINAATGVLPKDLPNPPTYRKVNPADFPIMIYAVHSDAVPEYRLDDYANTILAQRLSTVPGVGQVSIFGQKPYAARVQVNPAALAAHGIGLEDVRNALAAATVNLPKGTIEGQHEVVALETNDQLFDAAAYGNLIIAYRNGAPVRLSDVGDVLNSVQNVRMGAWFDNRAAEGIAIQKAPGANTIALVDTIKELMPKLEQSIPPSVNVELMVDRTQVTRAAVHDVQFTMMLTITLVVIVIFLFLRTIWATLIAVFIPLFFMGGIIGRLFREFAITVSVAVMASAVVSLTLTPVMCSLFLKEQGLHPKGGLNRLAERFFEWMIGAYDRGLHFVFRHQFATLASTLLLMVATGVLYVKIPKGFFPQQDTGTVFGEVNTRQDFVVPLDGRDRPPGRRHPARGSRRLRRLHACRRLFVQSDRKCRPRLLRAEAVRGAHRYGRSDRAALAPEGGCRTGCEVLHAGAAKHHGRRPPQPDTVPIHADRYRRRRTQSLGADPRRGDAQTAGASGRRFGPAKRCAYSDDRCRPRRRLPARPV